MKFQTPGFWIGVLSMFGVSYLVLQDVERTSPGDLAAVHQREDDLADAGNCDACHGSGDRGMAASCMECHADIRFQIESDTGLHGSLEERLELECAFCHSDHHGETFTMVNARSFELAGSDITDFDHELVGFRMEGKHLEAACTDCHASASKKVLEPGEKRFLGLNQDCASCHADPHEGRMVRSCVECHGQHDFLDLEGYAHTESFPLVGRHAGLSCRDCHAQEDPRSIEALVRPDNGLAERGCADCHEDPHNSRFVEAVARFVQQRTEHSCASCHQAEHESFTDPAVEVTPALHARTGFSLGAPHDQAACADCHAPPAADFAQRFPGRRPDDCVQCHDDPHGGQFDHPPFSQFGCVACHDTHRFEPHAFTPAKHAYTDLPLDGAHLSASCEQCHADVEHGARVFAGTPAQCAACHEDAHRGFFQGRVQGDCSTCHATSAFHQLPDGRFDHEQHTGFALRGAHAQAACESCHPRADRPDEAGRSFGFASLHFGRVEGCATCHEDPHAGRFDRPDQPRAVAGREGCARCHVESSFRAFEEDFDHALWTGFPLRGVHSEIDCTACHEPLLNARPDGRTWKHAVGSSCSDCHEDPHAGQFRKVLSSGRSVTDCGRCHTNRTFTDLKFNHNRDARFALDRAHRQVACNECHQPWTLPGGEEVVRYRPLGMECVDCHGVNKDQLRANKGTRR